MRLVARAAQPTNLQRLQVVIVVGFRWLRAALLARLLGQKSQALRVHDHLLRGNFVLVLRTCAILSRDCIVSGAKACQLFWIGLLFRNPLFMADGYTPFAYVADSVWARPAYAKAFQCQRLLAVDAPAWLPHAGKIFLSGANSLLATPLLVIRGIRAHLFLLCDGNQLDKCARLFVQTSAKGLI